MQLYKLLQIIVLAYTALVILFVIFTSYFTFRYWRNQSKAQYEMHSVLNKMRGRNTILLPLRVLSVIFIISWLVLALPWVDAILYTHVITKLHNGIMTTWFGQFAGKQGDYYFMTVLVSVLGAKGFFLIKQFADILSDSTLEVRPYGHMDYKKRL